MSVNLLDLAKGYVSDAVVNKAASFLGESAEATQSGFTHALPALLGGVMDKANSSSGAANVLGLLNKPELGSGLLNNIDDLFGGSNNSMMNLGGTLLNAVLGGKLPNIADLIGDAVGFKNKSSSNGLLKMAMPLLMGVISKKVGNSGVGGLLDVLSGQKKHIEDAAPAGFLDKMTSALGVGSLGNLTNNLSNNASNFTSNTSNVVNDATDDIERGAKKGGNKLLPLLGLLALLLLAFFAYKSCNGKKAVNSVVDGVKEGTETVVDAAKDGANAVKDGANAVGNAVVDGADAIYNAGANLVGKTVKGFENLGEFVSRKLSDGTELIIPSKGFEAQLVDFIESDKAVDKTTWFDMRRVLFKTGAADLDERSMNQIDNVANILKAYPNVDLKIGGYTDNTGNPAANKTLSANRATSVMKALLAKGIAAERLTAEGYGQEHPIASNDTEEGRQLNRRVSARVTKK